MSSAPGLDVGEVAVVVVVGGADQRAPVPGQGEDRPVLARRDDAGRARRSSSRSIETVTWVPRLGAIRGTSASSWISSGRIRSAQTPVALITLSASTSNRSPVSASTQATPAARPSSVEQAGDLGAVEADGAEALGLAEDRQHQAHVVGLAVVEEVGLARVAVGERRDQLDHLLAGDRAVAVGGPVVVALRSARRARGATSRPGSSPSRRTCSARSRSSGCACPRRASGPGTASGRRGAARAGPSAGARAAPRGPGRGRSSAGSAGRRGPSSTSGSRCRPRSRRARRSATE